MAIPKQQVTAAEVEAEAAPEAEPAPEAEAAPEAESAPVPALYKVKNITQNTLVLNGKPILPGEEGTATLAEVTTLVGYVEELGAV